MKISVIIPVYNGEKYLAQCLENILYQTYKKLEIIVVNDGSTDKSAEIAEKYPVKIIHQKNSGVSAARNTGISCATGDYIHFMDADDLINLDFYGKMIASALATDADMVCCEMIHERLPDRSFRFNEKTLISNVEDKMQMTNVREQGYCWRYLFKTDFLKTVGLLFEPELRCLEDLLFSFQAVFFSNKITFCPQAIYYYKHREQSAMTSVTEEHLQIRKACQAKVTSLCEEFAQKHNLKNLLAPPQKVYYKLFGIPLLKKQIFIGKVRWYLFGVYFFQRKNSGK